MTDRTDPARPLLVGLCNRLQGALLELSRVSLACSSLPHRTPLNATERAQLATLQAACQRAVEPLAVQASDLRWLIEQRWPLPKTEDGTSAADRLKKPIDS